MKEVMTASEAAKVLGVSPAHIRSCIDRGLYPFGIRLESEKGERNQYIVYTRRMEAWLSGRDILSDKEIVEDMEEMYKIMGRVLEKARKGSI